jgi:hypothetical protein
MDGSMGDIRHCTFSVSSIHQTPERGLLPDPDPIPQLLLADSFTVLERRRMRWVRARTFHSWVEALSLSKVKVAEAEREVRFDQCMRGFRRFSCHF